MTPKKSKLRAGSLNRWDRYHIIPQLAVYTTYIPVIYVAPNIPGKKNRDPNIFCMKFFSCGDPRIPECQAESMQRCTR